MKIVCIGGGPSGLYFAISMMLRSPQHEITVIERNRPDDTFGWGVVFSDGVVADLTRNDPKSAQAVTEGFIHWNDIDVHYRGEVITSGGMYGTIVNIQDDVITVRVDDNTRIKVQKSSISKLKKPKQESK